MNKRRADVSCIDASELLLNCCKFENIFAYKFDATVAAVNDVACLVVDVLLFLMIGEDDLECN